MENKKSEGSLKWDNSYLLGNEQVDNQHRELFDKVNLLISSCENGSAIEEVKETLEFLVNYAVCHFDAEEALQLEHNYPEYEHHKKLHDDFKVTVIETVKKFEETGSSSELNKDITSVIVKWLITHILNEDKKIGAYLRSIGM